MTEPGVTLTDYLLALECGAFALWLQRGAPDTRALRPAFVLFFAAASLAALLGGTVHGFFGHEGSAGFRLLWPATLLSIGCGATAGWLIGGRLTFSAAVARRVAVGAWLLLSVYAVAVLGGAWEFWVAVAAYLPAALCMLVGFGLEWRRRQSRAALRGVLGMLLTFAAAAVQQLGIAPHPTYFDHNALYHSVQAFAFFYVFRAAGGLCGEDAV